MKRRGETKPADHVGTCQGCDRRLMLRCNLCSDCYTAWSILTTGSKLPRTVQPMVGESAEDHEARIVKYEERARLKKPLFD